MIDCHCHLDTFVKNETLHDVLARADSAGVTQLVAAGTNREDWEIYRELATAFPQKIFYTAGLHPTEVEDGFESQLDALETVFQHRPYPVAIGEVGLDNYWLPKEPEEAERVRARQRIAFSRQLAWAKKMALPIVVHAREAFAETLAMIDSSGLDWSLVDFHCFSEGEKEMREINARGGRASFTGTLTYKNAENVRSAALAQGLSRLMLETDCPYLAPLNFRGKRNEPAYLRATAEFAATLFGVSAEEIFEKTTANTRAFFRL